MRKKDLWHPKNLLPAEGLQYYSVKEAKRSMRMISSEQRKKLCVTKDERPQWYPEEKWRQTYTLTHKRKAKILKERCL